MLAHSLRLRMTLEERIMEDRGVGRGAHELNGGSRKFLGREVGLSKI